MMLFSALPSFAQSVVTTLGAANSLNGPTFLAIDTRTIGGVNATWLYVAEHGNTDNTGGGRILRYNLTSGSATATVVSNAFTSPDAIVIDGATGDLFVADRAQNRVRRITNTGTQVSEFGVGQLRGPTGMVRDGSGNFYITEHGDTTPVNNQGAGGGFVSKWNSSGSLVTAFGTNGRIGGQGSGNGQFAVTGPYGVALSGSNLLVADSFSGRIQVFNSTTGAYQSQFSTGSGTLPLGLNIDSTGALWAAVSSGGGSGSIQEARRMPASGGAATMTLTNSMSLPFHVAVDAAANRAYVSDYGNDRVVVFNTSTSSGGGVPAISSAASASGTVGQNFSYQITASNSPTSYAIVSGDALPAGLTLNTTTGAITGIPSAAGTTTTRLTATNASGTSAPFTLTTTITTASNNGTPALPLGPVITNFDLVPSTVVQGVSAQWEITFSENVTGVDTADFLVNTQGSATASVTGVTGSGTTYRVAMNYTDQNGSIQMAIRTSGTGITGASGNAFRGAGHTATPVYPTGATGASDTSRPQVSSVTAGAPSGNNATFTVTFSEAVTGVGATDFIITGTSATIGTVGGSGTTYTVPITASGGGTVTLTVVGGATSNIRDAATNILGGAGTTSGNVTIAGGGGSGSAPVISSATTASATVGTAFSYQITASGSPTSYAATGLSGTGLSINTTTGAITGTPTASGTITSSLTATNANGTSAPVTLTITVSPASSGSAPVISSATTASATVGTAFSYQITASGSPTSYAATGLSGTGLSLNASTGAITGTPTAAGTITSSLTATNANGTSAPRTLTITVSPASTGSAPVISSATTASATVGTAFSYQISASGSPTSYAATGLSGTGLSLNASTGAITGTPTAAGTITSSLTATNANGTSAAVTLTITVNPASTPGGVPVVTGATLNLRVGDPVSYQVQATNSPTLFQIASEPPGVTMSSSGLITGSPSLAGVFNARVTVSNAAGFSSGTIVFNVTGNNGNGNRRNQTIVLPPPVSQLFVGQSFTLAGTASSGLPLTYSIITGNATITGNTLMINGAGPIVIRASQAGNTTWAPASSDVTFSAQRRNMNFSELNVPTKTYTADGVALDLTSDAGTVSYTVVSGPATISNGRIVFTGTGNVTVRASVAGNNAYNSGSSEFTINATPVPRLVNLSTRLRVTAGDATGSTIAGFYVTGETGVSKQILIRAVGPTLGNFGVGDPLADPSITVRDSSGAVVGTNAGWNDNAQITATGDRVGAFKLGAGSKDAALVLGLTPGAYTVQVQSATNSGTVLIEAYDVTADAAVPTKQLLNISTRGVVASGDQIIAGFSISGMEPKRVLVRAVGPGLAAFGVPSVMADPMVTIYRSNGTTLASNDNWGTQVAPATAANVAAMSQISGAFPLVSGSADSAIVLELPAGSYTAVVTGANDSTGAVLVEVYEIPNL